MSSISFLWHQERDSCTELLCFFLHRCVNEVSGCFHNVKRPSVSLSSALPKQFEAAPSDLSIHLNDTAMFECQSPGLPAPDVRWFRDSVALTPGPKTGVYPTGVLEVAAVTAADFAQYRCEVSNMERARFSPFARLVLDLDGELVQPVSGFVHVGWDEYFTWWYVQLMLPYIYMALPLYICIF